MALINWVALGFPLGIWDEKKIWEINLPVTMMNISELLWFLDVPFWESDYGEEFVITPRMVMERHPRSTKEWARMMKADLSFPLDIMYYDGKYITLDGVHRLMKANLQGMQDIAVRIFPQERFSEITIS